MCRDADNSRSRSLGTSLLARPSDSCLDSRCPRRRYPASPVTSPRCGPHYPRDHRNVASRPLATSVAKPSAPFSRTPDMPIHESSYTPRDPDRRSCPPELRTFSTLARWLPCTSARSYASDSRDFSLENSDGPFKLQIETSAYSTKPCPTARKFPALARTLPAQPLCAVLRRIQRLISPELHDFKSLRKNSCTHSLRQIFNHD
jgi:hypothetical protein